MCKGSIFTADSEDYREYFFIFSLISAKSVTSAVNFCTFAPQL